MKQLEKTDLINSRLKAAVGPDVDLDTLAVFEATALNTMPLRKKHPLYSKAVVDPGVLYLMSEQVAKESIQLHLNHNDWVLPVGRVFYSEVTSGPELRALFFMPKTEAEHISLIESGTVDQVSVSFMPKHVTCSKCGFDFLGKDATFDNIWSGTCDQGHMLGQAGVFAKLSGLEEWYELSLVGMGGAQGARIHGKTTSILSENQRQRLAASGHDPNVMVVRLSSQELAKVPDPVHIDVESLVAKFADDAVARKTAEVRVAALEADLAARDSRITELEAGLTEAKKFEARAAELEPAADALAYLTELAGDFAVAAGLTKQETLTLSQAKELIVTSRAKLKTLLPMGGAAAALSNGNPSQLGSGSTSAFTTRSPR